MKKTTHNSLSREFQTNQEIDKVVLTGFALTAAVALTIVFLAIWCLGG